eukprot:12784917-Alexandrium_andersonii.AAC.1
MCIRDRTSSLRVATPFNEIVQWGVLPRKQLVISHLIDEALRWTVASALPGRRAVEILAAIARDTGRGRAAP